MRVPTSLSAVLAAGALLVLFGLFARLGLWQWHRAGESRAVAEQFEAAASALPLIVPPPALGESMLRFRRLDVRGAYAAQPQFLLDNMVHDGVAGYHVLTPLRVDGDRWLLVNRGWLPVGPDRKVLPEVVVGGAARSVRGRLERLPRPGLRLAGSAAGAPAALAVLSYPTAADLAARLEEPVFDYQLLLDPAEPDGFVRDWRAPGLGSERHLMYAGQWLLLAAGAAGAAVVILVKTFRRFRDGARAA